jgi:uncharacterized protein (TIGR02391 family)
MSIYSTVPDIDDLLALSPAQLGGLVIEHLAKNPPNVEGMVHLKGAFGPETLREYGARRDEAAQALAEGWAWLINHGLLVPHVEQHAHGWYVLSRHGRTLRSRDKVSAYARGSVLPQNLVHPTILAVSEAAFVSGDYQTAVRSAFVEVEIAVRQAAPSLSPQLTGVDLMRAAFQPTSGPLREDEDLPGEREGLMHLLAGTMGAFRNPTSHRRVSIRPEDAARLLVFASFLLDTVDSRRP